VTAITATTGRRREFRLVGWVVLIGAAAVALLVMRPDQIFRANTPTGGDMGAHVLIPAYLRDTLLADGRIMGWSNDWYAGFPILYFYFPIPALTIVLFDLVLPYGVAFKIVTVAGLVGLPFASYYFARSMGFARPVSLVGGVAGATFVFMESRFPDTGQIYSIFGGNTLSTLAGEYSFSWSFALSLVYLGMVIRNTRQGRGFTVGAGVVLALAALSHVITTLVVVVASLPLLFRRKGTAAVTGAWALGFGLAAFWAVPLLMRVQDYTTDMGWNPVQGHWKVFQGDLWPMLLLGAVGLLWAAARKATIGPALVLMVFPIIGYYGLEYLDWTKLYNARLLPYWYYVIYLFAGIAVGLAVVAIVRRGPSRGLAVWLATGVASAFFLVVGGVGVSRAPAWANWNYSGYEAKEGWQEYEALIAEIDRLPPGRVMWEAYSEFYNRYGTPMALMLTGYWSEGHPSMEGLLFESSITTPFHFLNAAEVSENPSNPIGGLRYHRLDFERAVPHLMLYDVAYYVATTDAANEKAAEAGLEVLAEVDPFTVYALPEADLVEVGSWEPAVWGEDGGFVDAALEWYDDIELLDRWLVAEGPDDWRRIDEATDPGRRSVRIEGAVDDVVLEDHRISFRTTAVGAPHLVKVSHFPNWQATGAEGPYRAAPSLMVVVPTQEEVTIEFRNTAAENGGMLLTVITLLGLAAWGVVRWRRRQTALALPPQAEADAQQADDGAGDSSQEA
jgi:hypothetical protein